MLPFLDGSPLKILVSETDHSDSRFFFTFQKALYRIIRHPIQGFDLKPSILLHFNKDMISRLVIETPRFPYPVYLHDFSNIRL